jgi:hypothetical protein
MEEERVNPDIKSILDRADELLNDLGEEYNHCLQASKVTSRAKNITHEILEKLRGALDQTMFQAWEKYVSHNLPDQQRESARVYFPIASDLNSFRSVLGRGGMPNLDNIRIDLYDFLLNRQPFMSKENQWLALLSKIAAEGKHIRLTPQKRTEIGRIKVSKSNGGSVSWDPSSVRFGPGVSIVGAPIDPRTQRIVPTPGVTEQREIWVSFILEGYGVNALGFCKEACQKTRVLIEEMGNFL